MTITTYGEWHTVTVLIDGENEDGSPCVHYELAHVESCAPPAPWNELPHARCHVEHLIWEWASDHAEDFGIPTEPGTYRMRAWSEPGHWCGPHWEDPDEGIEVDDEVVACPRPA